MTWQNGLTEAYQYSSQGEAMERSVSFPGRGILESESIGQRDGLGRKREAGFTTPGGVRQHTYAYDSMGRLTGSTRRLQPSTGPQTSATYQYDNALARDPR